MAKIYDGTKMAKGAAQPNGSWGWDDFGWQTSYPSTLAECCPEAELAKARTATPAFAAWIGEHVGDDGTAQSCAAARNAAESLAREAEIVARSPQVMNHGGLVTVVLCEDGE